MNPPVESVASTPVPFDGGLQWRSAVGITSSISAQSPLSPVDQSLSLKNAPTALSEASGKMNEQPQINMTLSYLGLEGSPVVAPAAKFILPESAVKRNSLRKASFPSPIGSIIDHKEMNGLKPLQGQSSGMHGHMQALFQNPFMPGIEFSATLGKGGTNVSGNSLYNRGEGKTSGFDALFARLTPYQQSMVSPIVWDPNNSGSLINYDGSRDENVPP
jgi:hypothetical protein